jgi:hypothetical protein
MPDTRVVLKEWIIEYLKSKDLMTRHITAIKQNEQDADVVIESALKNQLIIVQPQLGDLGRLQALKDKHIVLVTTNTKENMEFLLSNWAEIVQCQHLSVYFVNPNSSLDKRWVIFPATHDRITERNALRKGIESLFATVEPWRE